MWTFFQAPHAHNRAVTQQRRDGIRHAMPATTDQAVLRASVMVGHTLGAQVRGVAAAIRRFEPEIAGLTRAHADVQLCASLPGAGPVRASRVISALGTDRSRDACVADVLPFAGLAPIIDRSGNTSVTPFRWFGPTGLRHSFHACAGQSIQSSRWANAFSRQQRMRGKDHQAAGRSLACQWTRMIFHMWTRRTPDHERTYMAALQRRGSSLCQLSDEHPVEAKFSQELLSCRCREQLRWLYSSAE